MICEPDTDLMVKCASGNDTDTHSMVRLGSGADGLGCLMVMIKLAKTVSLTYRHWITLPNFRLLNISGLVLMLRILTFDCPK